MIFRIGCLIKIVIIVLVLFIALVSLLNSQWFMKIIYPEPYKEIVTEMSQKYQIDPFLIMAMIRVESKFNAEALSYKGARGLMQVLPDTGKWIAKQLKYQDFHPDMLFDPKHNINLGTWYLAYLLKQFNNNTVVAIAAYNGGETNVKKWINEGTWSGNFNDLNEIPFKETRNYVNKVIADYQVYYKLYKK